MSNSYNNHGWSQHQPMFSQPLPTTQDFDFAPLPAHSNGIQRRSKEPIGFTFRAQHPHQLLSEGGPSSAVMHPNFPPNQSTQRQPTQFGINTVPVQTNTFNSGTYGSSNQTVQSFTHGPLLSSPQAEWNIPSSIDYHQPNNATFTGISEQTYGHPNTSPPPAQRVFPQHVLSAGIPPAVYTVSPNTTVDPRGKRTLEHAQDEGGDDDQDLDVSDAKEGVKIKSRACGRCKNLKVRCEPTETDKCKRCLNGGHDCFIPGRKKRRAPPKREDLINKIDDQARQIEQLMAQLESLRATLRRRPSSVGSSDYFTSSPSLQSPIPSPSSDSDAHSPTDSDLGNKAIEDWIAKAKQSLQEFDVFIGAGMPKSYIVEDEIWESTSDDYDDSDHPSRDDIYECGIAVEGPDGQEVADESFEGTLKHKSSASSIATHSTGVAVKDRKNVIRRAKPAIIPNPEFPFGLFGQMSLKTVRQENNNEADEDGDKPSGIAGKDFFRSAPTPVLDQRLAGFRHAQILTRKIITPQEAEKLFQIYFDNMNLSVSLLDPVLYTPQKALFRSPFLFTVVCAIASRFYSERPELYTQLMHYAQQAAGLALISGPKNVEMCSAYILLSLYPVPAKKWEDQRGWLYLGLALRTATDLNLNIPNTAKPRNESHAREMLNRTRVWLNCFNLDRSTGSQYGKLPIISHNDYMANNSQDWWKSSPHNMKHFDIHICAYNAELQVMGNFIGRMYGGNSHDPTGLNKDIDFEKIATETDEELKQLEKKWADILKEADVTDPRGNFRTGLLKLAYPYARLIALSYGFQHAFSKNHTHENPFLMRCLDAAFDVVCPVLSDLCRPSQCIYLRHGPEAQSVFITFASAFLVKLLQPKFASYLSYEKRCEIRELVQKVVDRLGSSEIAIDDRHGPKLYSKFLRNLLATPMAKVNPDSPSGPLRKPKNTASSMGKVTPEPPPLDTNATTLDPSPAPRNSSLSPPPRAAALSFNIFAPSGGLDPFVPDLGVSNSLALYDMGDDAEGLTGFLPPTTSNYGDFFSQGMQFMTHDASSWQNPPILPHADSTWDSLFQHSSLNSQDTLLYGDADYPMTGP